MALTLGVAVVGTGLSAPATASSSGKGTSSATAASDPTITVSVAGNRTSPTGNPPGQPGVTLRATGNTDGATGECTTGGNGTCTISLTSAVTQTYTVEPVALPPGWFRNPVLGAGSSSNSPSLTYDAVTTAALAPGGSTTIPVASNTTAATSRGPQIAISHPDTLEPTTCGLRVGLVMDLSSSIVTPTNHLPTYLSAAESFVSALEGTPSEVSLFTFGTNAPATSAPGTTNNTNLPLTPVSTTAGANTVRNKIAGLTVQGTQSTNWDAGLWQVAAADQHLDVVIMLTDGDPTLNGRPNATGNPPGAGTTSRLIDVENGIFSANAVKDATDDIVLHPALLAVGVNVTGAGSIANLRAISGPGEFFTAGFEDLADTLDSLAREQCLGSVSVIKQVVPRGGTISQAAPAAGWEFHSTHPAESRVSDETGGVSFETGASTTPTTITETLKSGYTALPEHTACVNIVTDDPVPIEHVTHGFTVTPDPNGIISCQVFNEAPAHPGIRIEKTVFPDEFGVAGEELVYTFDVRNTGNVPLTDVRVDDNHLGNIICPRNELGPGEHMTCHFRYFTTEHDVAVGHVHNVVAVSGRDPDGEHVTDEDDANVDRVHGPGIQLEKVAFPTQYAVPGEVIHYTYRVVNTGISTLHDIALVDSRLGHLTCPHTVLEPGAEMDCSASHTITADDVAAGRVHNVATVTGHDPQGRVVDDTDDATVTAIHGPGLQIQKTAAPGTFSGAGQLLTYTYRVVNTGNVTIHDVHVGDSKVGTDTTCAATTLHPGEETICTATYFTTQADVERGYVPNFAFAQGEKPNGLPITTPYTEAIVVSVLPEVPVTG